MNSWILSIVGIVCLGVIIDIFIPEGQTNKYIKSIFSLLIVLVIISPLPNLFNGNFSFTNIFNNLEAEVDINFIASVNKDKKEEIEKILKNQLSNNKLKFNAIDVSCNFFQEEFEILNIYVDISNINMKNVDEHKNQIINVIQSSINISKEKIIFHE